MKNPRFTQVALTGAFLAVALSAGLAAKAANDRSQTVRIRVVVGILNDDSTNRTHLPDWAPRLDPHAITACTVSPVPSRWPSARASSASPVKDRDRLSLIARDDRWTEYRLPPVSGANSIGSVLRIRLKPNADGTRSLYAFRDELSILPGLRITTPENVGVFVSIPDSRLGPHRFQTLAFTINSQ